MLSGPPRGEEPIYEKAGVASGQPPIPDTRSRTGGVDNPADSSSSTRPRSSSTTSSTSGTAATIGRLLRHREMLLYDRYLRRVQLPPHVVIRDLDHVVDGHAVGEC